MKSALLTIEQGWSAQLILLEGLWHFAKHRFEKNSAAIGTFITSLNTDSECYEEWQECCHKNSNQKPYQERLLTQKDVLLLIIMFTSYYQNQLGFDLAELSNVYILMESGSTDSKELNKLWDQAIQRALNGERRINDPKLYSW
jgi:hypothetical protein